MLIRVHGDRVFKGHSSTIVARNRESVLRVFEDAMPGTVFTANEIAETLGEPATRIRPALKDLWEAGWLVSWFEGREREHPRGGTQQYKTRCFALIIWEGESDREASTAPGDHRQVDQRTLR